MSKHIVIGPDGTVRAIYDPETVRLLEAAGLELRLSRASRVDPGSSLGEKALRLLVPEYAEEDAEGNVHIKDQWQNHWFIDMTPLGIDRVFGPFAPADHDAAIRFEVDWLRRNYLGLGKGEEE